MTPDDYTTQLINRTDIRIEHDSKSYRAIVKMIEQVISDERQAIAREAERLFNQPKMTSNDHFTAGWRFGLRNLLKIIRERIHE